MGLLAEETAKGRATMRIDGWIFMLASWGVILGMTIFCLIRTLRQKDQTRQ